MNGQMFGGTKQLGVWGRGEHDNDRAHPRHRPMHLAGRADQTETRYFYLRRCGKLAFVEKRSPVIHLEPCNSCPDYSSHGGHP